MEKPKNWRFADLEGRVFGRLTVVEFAGRKGKKLTWRCRCECGKETTANACHLVSGKHASCGCLHIDKITKHGMFKTTEYRSWMSMKSRCTNPNAPNYDRYGGRGITVCERWASFEGFIADMGLKPTPKHTIERIDNDGNYEPGNCRWATRGEQALNRHFTPPAIPRGRGPDGKFLPGPTVA